MTTEIKRCQEDILYFKEKYLGLSKDAVQDECIRLILEKNKINLDTGRATKKTTAAVVVILHKFLFETKQTIGLVSKTQSLAIDNLALVKYYYDRLPEFLKFEKTKLNKTEMINVISSNRIVVKSFNENSFRGTTANFILADCLLGLKKTKVQEFFEAVLPQMSATVDSKIVVLETMDVDNTINESYDKIVDKFFYYDGTIQIEEPKTLENECTISFKKKIKNLFERLFNFIKG